jgi:hypothetical protein
MLQFVTTYLVSRVFILLFKVQISFVDSPGVELLNNSSIALACVSERTTFVQQFHIRALDLGYMNITVSAEVDPMYPEECGPETLVHMKYVLLHEGFTLDLSWTS